jgi:hypothetical protein
MKMETYFWHGVKLASVLIRIMISIVKWNAGNKVSISWKTVLQNASLATDYDIFSLKAGTNYTITRNGKIYGSVKSDPNGTIHFRSKNDPHIEDLYEIRENE